MFDGDQMAVYIPHTLAYSDATDKMWIDNNLRLPSNGSFIYQLRQDMVLGLNNITKFDETDVTEYLGVRTTNKRVSLFQTIFPESQYNNVELFVKFNIEFDKKTSNGFIDQLEKQHILSSPEFIRFLDLLCRIGFDNSHTTLSLNDFNIPNARTIDDSSKFPDNFATKMIRSGARGSWSQYYQMVVEKGFITDIAGKVHPEKVEHNLMEGLSPREFFITCYGGRKGLIDSADNTAKSGYLTRKLIYLLSPTILNTTIDDCYESLGNTRYFEMYVRDESIAKMLIGRYTIDIHITEDNYKDIIGKTIQLKSPVTCKAPGICKKCYGDLYNIHHSKMIGIIAAQSLGERTTQLTLRTKHTSGSTDTSEILGDLKSYLKIENNIVVALREGSMSVQEEFITFKFDENEFTFDNFDTYELLLNDDQKESDDTYTFGENDELVSIDVSSNDIVSTVTILSGLLNKPESKINLSEYLYQILDLYGTYANIAIVHFELILSTLCRSSEDFSIQFRHSNDSEYTMMGLSKVIALCPEQALAFERFFFYLKKFLINDISSQAPAFSLLRAMLFFDFDKLQE